MAENTPRVLDERDVAWLAQKYLHGEFLGLSEFIRTVEDAVLTQQRHVARGYSLMTRTIEKASNNA
ncbi:hypothetical protein [Noviherbaspirillum sp. Root189]|uniref:hypothetical protein n=1 Tax=Noviherbaspirillum sp. Root189 TaxID=1736487 RepID=UPI000709A97B|nr:hypothetical protein [Noviherbaspirillum sp. Root189]KRB83461.1 hypothetical protein ASE07_23645 [Noviherbaspirillum sp. Root189]